MNPKPQHIAWRAIDSVIADLEREADEHANPIYEDCEAGDDFDPYRLIDEGYRRGLLSAISALEGLKRSHIEAVERWAQDRVDAERARLRRWHLRLKWRSVPVEASHDRLRHRALRYPSGAFIGCAPGEYSFLPIAGVAKGKALP